MMVSFQNCSGIDAESAVNVNDNISPHKNDSEGDDTLGGDEHGGGGIDDGSGVGTPTPTPTPVPTPGGGNNGGNGTTQQPAAATINVLDTVWYPMRPASNPSGTAVINQNSILALKVDFSDPRIVYNFLPSSNAAFKFYAIYNWKSPEEDQQRIAYFNGIIRPLVNQRTQIEAAMVAARIACGITPLAQCAPYQTQLALFQAKQRQISAAFAAYGTRIYDANQFEEEIVDANGAPPPNHCFGPAAGAAGVSFSFVQRANQSFVVDCADVRANKTWFIRLKVNHCNYTHRVVEADGDVINTRGADANCQLKFEVWRDLFYFNQ